MNDFLKLAIAAPFVVFCMFSIAVWADGVLDWSDAGAPLLALAAFIPVWWSFSRRGSEPDILAQQIGGGAYFERRGFCFAICSGSSDGHAFIEVHFQNRFAKPCRGKISLRASEGFFLNRPRVKIPPILLECDGGAYGVARLRFGVPLECQGKQLSFDVFANSRYPRGRGKRLRFTEACHVGGAGFNGWSVLAILGALGGAIVLTKPAKTKFLLPTDVADSIEGCPLTEVETLWRPSDPPPDVI